MFYVKLYVHSFVDKLKWFYENARCYNKICTDKSIVELFTHAILTDDVLNSVLLAVNRTADVHEAWCDGGRRSMINEFPP